MRTRRSWAGSWRLQLTKLTEEEIRLKVQEWEAEYSLKLNRNFVRAMGGEIRLKVLKWEAEYSLKLNRNFVRAMVDEFRLKVQEWEAEYNLKLAGNPRGRPTREDPTREKKG